MIYLDKANSGAGIEGRSSTSKNRSDLFLMKTAVIVNTYVAFPSKMLSAIHFHLPLGFPGKTPLNKKLGRYN
jgi:hypothetical protein